MFKPTSPPPPASRRAKWIAVPRALGAQLSRELRCSDRTTSYGGVVFEPGRQRHWAGARKGRNGLPAHLPS
ncbi:MAG: hypothetical protein HY905_09560 [Deltaproteobacteria bacterium]|nr:hypothetical protein [Deltaproteobacteria bacterium]